VSQSVLIPVAAVLAIYAQETGQGMMLPEDGTGTLPPDEPIEPDPAPGDGPRRGGHLRIVK
jgi:stringent starvation protein B